jgi:hypothetical protein
MRAAATTSDNDYVVPMAIAFWVFRDEFLAFRVRAGPIGYIVPRRTCSIQTKIGFGTL